MSDQQLRTCLDRYFSGKVQLRKEKKKAALKVWEDAVKEILQYVKSRDSRFDLRQFYGGSFYERAKVKEANEFDLMLEMENLKLGRWDPYGSDDDLSQDPPSGYTTVMIDQGEEVQWRHGGCIGNGNLLNATKVKALFADHVSVAIRELGYSRCIHTTSHGPAVTLNVNSGGNMYSIDLALAIKDESWPDDADEWKTRSRRGWPKPDLVKRIVSGGCHLVAKRPKRRGSSTRDDDFMWRYSFSSAEKTLFREGSSGGAGTCRHMLLRILKCLREDLSMTPLTSYHLKTIVLYECEEYPQDSQWKTCDLPERFRSGLRRLLKCLKERKCPHYFIRDVNLFDSNSFNEQRYQFLVNTVNNLLSDPCGILLSKVTG